MKKISINSLCEYLTASETRKRTIIKDQKKPSTFKIARYVTVKARILSYFKNRFDISEIIRGIEMLQNRTDCDTNFKRNDQKNSIAALHKFLQFQFPTQFKNLNCSFTKEKTKELCINNLDIIVSPDIIMRWEQNGQKYIGGIKFHIVKSKIFDYQQGIFAAGLIKLALEMNIATDDEIVISDACLSIDIFGERVSHAPGDMTSFVKTLQTICNDINLTWDVA